MTISRTQERAQLLAQLRSSTVALETDTQDLKTAVEQHSKTRAQKSHALFVKLGLSSPIKQVPDPILSAIFSNLNVSETAKCARVCKRWNGDAIRQPASKMNLAHLDPTQFSHLSDLKGKVDWNAYLKTHVTTVRVARNLAHHEFVQQTAASIVTATVVTGVAALAIVGLANSSDDASETISISPQVGYYM